MKVLVIDGTGYVGSHVVERLRARGFEVTVFSSGREPAALPADVSAIHGDRSAPEDVRPLARRGFEAVVDVSACRRSDTQMMVDAFAGSISRFVHLSTISANQLSTGFPLRESDPLVADPAAGYRYDRAECERALRQAHARSDFPYVAIRPSVIFGPRDRFSRESYYLKRILAGDPVILPDGGRTPVFAVYVGDVADAVTAAVVSADAPGRAFHLMMRERLSVAEHVANIAELVGREVETIEIPSRLLERAGFDSSWFPYFAEQILELDTSAAERDLGLRFTPYREALRTTIEMLLDGGPEALPSIEDRFRPSIPLERQTAFAREYRRRCEALEAEMVEWASGQ